MDHFVPAGEVDPRRGQRNWIPRCTTAEYRPITVVGGAGRRAVNGRAEMHPWNRPR